MNQVTILIVDDNFVVRRGLRGLLEEVDGITIVGEASTGAEAIEWMRKSSADIVLMDIRMPVVGGMQATAEIMRIRPESKVLMLTAIDVPYTLAQSILVGARGCLVYDCFSPEKLIRAIYSLVSGDSTIVPSSVEFALTDMTGNPQSDQISPAETAGDYLTPRQNAILHLIAEGKSNSEIAEILHLREKTVKNHIRSIYARLNVSNRYEAIKLKLTLEGR